MSSISCQNEKSSATWRYFLDRIYGTLKYRLNESKTIKKPRFARYICYALYIICYMIYYKFDIFYYEFDIICKIIFSLFIIRFNWQIFKLNTLARAIQLTLVHNLLLSGLLELRNFLPRINSTYFFNTYSKSLESIFLLVRGGHLF